MSKGRSNPASSLFFVCPPSSAATRNAKLTLGFSRPRQIRIGVAAFALPITSPPMPPVSFLWPLPQGLLSASWNSGEGAWNGTPYNLYAIRHTECMPFSQTGHRKYQKAFPVEWSINRISKSQSKAFEISCKSFIVKLLRLNLLWMFCGLVFILLASSVSVILPRFTNIILMYSVISIVITSPLSYT